MMNAGKLPGVGSDAEFDLIDPLFYRLITISTVPLIPERL